MLDAFTESARELLDFDPFEPAGWTNVLSSRRRLSTIYSTSRVISAWVNLWALFLAVDFIR